MHLDSKIRSLVIKVKILDIELIIKIAFMLAIVINVEIAKIKAHFLAVFNLDTY